MASGVAILDTVTMSCDVEATGKQSFKIILKQGLNRQIRRMCEELGYRVRRLKRVRIMNVELGDLPVGTYRPLDDLEMRKLREPPREPSLDLGSLKLPQPSDLAGEDLGSNECHHKADAKPFSKSMKTMAKMVTIKGINMAMPSNIFLKVAGLANL